MSAERLGPTRIAELLGTPYHALILDSEGEYGDVIAALTEALVIEPSNANALNNLGLAWEELGDRERARAAFEQALAVRPGNEVTSHNLSRLLDGEGYE